MSESPDEWLARAEALRSTIHRHPGRVAHQRWNSVQMVHKALLWNEHFLLHHVDFRSAEGRLRAFQMMGQDREQQENLQVFWLFLFTFLANFTSMNTTLVDHVRGLMASYKGTAFAKEEEQRRRHLGFAPVTQFLKDLRNFITHVTTPPLTFEMSFGEAQDVTYTATIDADRLAEAGRFSAAAREYFVGRDKVDIEAAVKEYAALREAYYAWLFSQFDKLHGAELAAHDGLVTELNGMYQRTSKPAWNIVDRLTPASLADTENASRSP